MDRHLTPAEYVRHVFGSYAEVAAALRIYRSVPHRWATFQRKGPSGLVPIRYCAALLTVAAARGLDLTAMDLIYGRTVTVPAPVAVAVAAPR